MNDSVTEIKNIWESDLPEEIRLEQLRSLPYVQPGAVSVLLTGPLSKLLTPELRYKNLSLSGERDAYIQYRHQRDSESAKAAATVSNAMFSFAGLSGASKIFSPTVQNVSSPLSFGSSPNLNESTTLGGFDLAEANISWIGDLLDKYASDRAAKRAERERDLDRQFEERSRRTELDFTLAREIAARRDGQGGNNFNPFIGSLSPNPSRDNAENKRRFPASDGMPAWTWALIATGLGVIFLPLLMRR